MRRSLTLLAFSCLALSCGAAMSPAEDPAEAPSTESEPADETESAASESAPSDAEAGSASASEAPPEKEAQPEGREIKYIVTAQGLEVEVAGVRFVTAAKAIQVGGGWGVRLTATAKAKDGKAHSLSSPKGGAIALAGTVKRGGQEERFGDKREGEGEQTIDPAAPLELSRDWPAKGGKPLRAGDEVDIEVGLWGLGDDAASRRPVRHFFHVNMVVGKQKPKPVVTPPPTQ